MKQVMKKDVVRISFNKFLSEAVNDKSSFK